MHIFVLAPTVGALGEAKRQVIVVLMAQSFTNSRRIRRRRQSENRPAIKPKYQMLRVYYKFFIAKCIFTMSKRLFPFNNDNHQEAEFVGEHLQQHGIEYYTTPGSLFTFSKPAIWVKNEEDFAEAQRILLENQPRYAKMARERYQAETGYNPNAPLKEQITFHLRHIYRKRKLFPLIILALALMYGYYSMFFQIF